MSDANCISWSQLLKEKREEFAQSGFELPSTAIDENTFRVCFENLCKTNDQPFYTRLLPKIRYDSINILANALDAVVGPVEQDSLSRAVPAAMLVSARVRFSVLLNKHDTSHTKFSAHAKLAYHYLE